MTYRDTFCNMARWSACVGNSSALCFQRFLGGEINPEGAHSLTGVFYNKEVFLAFAAAFRHV